MKAGVLSTNSHEHPRTALYIAAHNLALESGWEKVEKEKERGSEGESKGERELTPCCNQPALWPPYFFIRPQASRSVLRRGPMVLLAKGPRKS